MAEQLPDSAYERMSADERAKERLERQKMLVSLPKGNLEQKYMAFAATLSVEVQENLEDLLLMANALPWGPGGSGRRQEPPDPGGQRGTGAGQQGSQDRPHRGEGGAWYGPADFQSGAVLHRDERRRNEDAREDSEGEGGSEEKGGQEEHSFLEDDEDNTIWRGHRNEYIFRLFNYSFSSLRIDVKILKGKNQQMECIYSRQGHFLNVAGSEL